MTHEIEILAQDANKCGEAPTWDPVARRLIWVDNESDLVYELVPQTHEQRVISRGLMVSGIALNHDGCLIFAGFGGLHVWQDQGEYETIFAEHDGEKLQFNDIIADRHGGIYAGTLYWGAGGMEKTGRLYHIAPDRVIQVVEEGIQLANGLAFSPDDRTLYFSDSAARRIYAYDVDAKDGRLSRRRVFVDVPGDEGIPDGLTVDAAGFIWSAQWYGGQIVRYDPEGKVERRIAMPVKQVSSLTFGGKDLTELYVTSAGQSWRSRLAPPGYDFETGEFGGSLYRVRMDVSGRREHQARV